MTRLRLQLVALLVAVALLPPLLALPTVSSLLHRSLGSGLNARWLAGLDAGLASTRTLLEYEKERFERDWVSASFPGAGSPDGRDFEVMSRPPPELSRMGLTERRSAASVPCLLSAPERMGDHLVARALAPPQLHSAGAPDSLWIRRALPPGLSARADTLAAALVLAQGVQHERSHLLRAFLATFLVINGIFLLVVIALGLFLANRLTRPLEALARGMDAVAGGDLQVRLPVGRPGTIEQLAVNFNEMTSRLSSQQTDLLRLEKDAAWRDMARRLAHEIKNPLTPIQLAADEIRGAFPGGDARYQALLDEGTSIIREEVNRLRRLVQEFSRFARLPEPRWEAVEASSLLSAIGALYGPERVEIHLPTEKERVECDPEQMHRLLVNLVNNALEAQERIGIASPIRVEAHAIDLSRSRGIEPSRGRDAEPSATSTLRIDVADRGPGLPASERERVFEPGVTSRSEGMGLGLAIARSIATLHQGQITVTEREGGGAIFTVLLPSKRAEPKPATPAETRG